MATPNTPSPWHRNVREPLGALPRIHHAIEQTWVTEVDAELDSALTKSKRPLLVRRRRGHRLADIRGIVRRALTSQRIAQVQSVLYLVTGLWLALSIDRSMQGALPKTFMALRLVVAGTLWRWSWHREPGDKAAALGAAAAASLTIWAGAQLTQLPLTYIAGMDVVVQMGLVGLWLASLIERRQLTRLDHSLQPRPGRPLYH